MEQDKNTIQEDSFLSNILLEEQTKNVIQKNYRITSILIICSFIFVLENIISNIPLLDSQGGIEFDNRNFKSLFIYRISPALQILFSIVGLVAYFILKSSYRNFLDGIKENNSAKFNKGFIIFYRMNLLAALFFIIQLLHTIIYLTLK